MLSQKSVFSIIASRRMIRIIRIASWISSRSILPIRVVVYSDNNWARGR